MKEGGSEGGEREGRGEGEGGVEYYEMTLLRYLLPGISLEYRSKRKGCVFKEMFSVYQTVMLLSFCP